jgi:di/tricarboxylate transporter
MDAAVVVVVLVVFVIVVFREVVSPAAGMIAALVGLVLTGIVSVEEAFRGFGDQATVTIAGLFVVARAVQLHLAPEAGLARVLGTAVTGRGILLRLLPPVAASSGFLANTPLVATAAPAVKEWAERRGIGARPLLMPLSFAAILGGVTTTIGTSVTLLVSSLLARSTGEPLALFEVTPIGLPVAVVGTLVLVWLAPRVLRDAPDTQLPPGLNCFRFWLRVEPGGHLDGRTTDTVVLDGLQLVGVERDGRPLTDLAARFCPGDVLIVSGGADAIRGHLRPGGIAGVRPLVEEHLWAVEGPDACTVEAVIGRASPLVGRTPREVSFRGRYDAAIVAIERQGAPVDGRPGQVRFAAGDRLLLRADRGFVARWRDRDDFAVSSMHDAPPRRASSRRWWVVAVVAVTLGLTVSGVVTLVTAVLGACAALIGTRTLRFSEAKAALDVDVLLIIGASIGIASAVASTGLADGLAAITLRLAPGAGLVIVAAMILVITMLLTELVANAAAAAIMVPVVIRLAEGAALDVRALAIAVAIGASCSFLTPLGYQTNTIVYALGGYRVREYARLGAPLAASVIVVASLALAVRYG